MKDGQKSGSRADVGANHGAADEHARASKRLILALRSAGAGTWERDIPGGKLVWSDALFHMMGLVPTPGGTASFELWSSVLHPDDRARALERAHASVRDGTPLFNEYRVVLPNGDVRWIQAFGNTDYDARGAPLRTSGLCLDVTERKRAEEKMREANHWITETQFAMDRIGISILWSDAQDGRFLYVNDVACQMHGYSREELLGLSVSDINPAFEPGRFKEMKMTAEVRDRGVVRVETSHRHKDGRLIPVEVTVYFREGSPGSSGHFVAFATDISERKANLRALAEARDAAEAANRVKSEFLANISHEIRTPLSAIMGLTDLCATTRQEGEKQDYLTKIKQASSAMFQIINNLLDLSKIEAGKLDLEVVEFYLSDVFGLLATLFEQKARDRSVELHFRVADDVPEILKGDVLRLEQILINLVGNAIKFSLAGTVRVDVTVAGRQGDRTAIRFAVSDQGIGISAKQQGKLFLPFSQVDASTSRQHGGTGLGLAICRGLVEKMGGSIGVRSKVGKGSTFHFTIEFKRARKVPARGGRNTRPLYSNKAGLDISALAHCRGAEILLVEDVPLIRDMVTDMLKRCGLRVRVAGNGREAIRAVKERQPDAILMDCQMPHMDGYEATRRLRKDSQHARLPIVALTANAASVDMEKCIAAGMDACVSKPIDVPLLLALLDDLLQKPDAIERVRPAAAGRPAQRSSTSPIRDLPELAGIDVDAGLAGIANHDTARYAELLRMFRDGECKSFGGALAATLKRRAWKKAAARVHSLKGLSLMLGALTLARHADGLVAAIVARDAGAVARCQAATLEELARVKEGLAGL